MEMKLRMDAVKRHLLLQHLSCQENANRAEVSFTPVCQTKKLRVSRISSTVSDPDPIYVFLIPASRPAAVTRVNRAAAPSSHGCFVIAAHTHTHTHTRAQITGEAAAQYCLPILLHSLRASQPSPASDSAVFNPVEEKRHSDRERETNLCEWTSVNKPTSSCEPPRCASNHT